MTITTVNVGYVSEETGETYIFLDEPTMYEMGSCVTAECEPLDKKLKALHNGFTTNLNKQQLRQLEKETKNEHLEIKCCDNQNTGNTYLYKIFKPYIHILMKDWHISKIETFKIHIDPVFYGKVYDRARLNGIELVGRMDGDKTIHLIDTFWNYLEYAELIK